MRLRILVLPTVALAAVAQACGGSSAMLIEPFDGGSSTEEVLPDGSAQGKAPDGGGSDALADTDAGTDASDAGRDATVDAPAPPDATVEAGPVQATLTVLRSGPSGTVTWDGGTCGPGCSTSTMKFAVGTTVTLTATTTNGSNALFTGFRGGDCSGAERTCTVKLDGDLTVTAPFETQTSNVVFGSSVTYASNLGGVAPYDAACNTLASAAGINSVAGDRFMAWMSSSSASVFSRLGTARGFVRIDNRPFADRVSALATDGAQIFYPIVHDEKGARHTGDSVMTGTNSYGFVGNSCSDWTATTGTSLAGDLGGGPRLWTAEHTVPCNVPRRILCVGTASNASVFPAPVVGKRIFLTNTNRSSGATTPNTHCDADKPPGVEVVRAVIATSGSSAASKLNATALYVRPDGVVVGRGATIAALGEVEAGFWQDGNGTYGRRGFWTGAVSPSDLGSDTCFNWTFSSGALDGRYGYGASVLLESSWEYGKTKCNDAMRFLCVED